MDFFLKFDVSFFSVMMLLLILMTIYMRNDTSSYSSILFRRLICINIIMLLLEVLSWVFDGRPGKFNYYFNYISNMLYGWLTPFITAMWASYIDYQMFGSRERLKKRWYYIYPFAANTILFIINLFVPVVFSVNSQNIYSREAYMWLIVCFNAVVLVYMCGVAYKYRKSIKKSIIFMLLFYVFFPSVAAGIQVSVYGAFIIWPTMSVAIVLTYIFLETMTTSRDYLTGVYNRTKIDERIEFQFSKNAAFGLVMFDLNDFKNINDKYGHREGDRALVIFSNALNVVFSDAIMVGRYAGDEFIVITEAIDYTSMELYKTRLKDHLKEETKTLEYDLKFSMGYQIRLSGDAFNYETLIDQVDQKMYSDKKLSKGETQLL